MSLVGLPAVHRIRMAVLYSWVPGPRALAFFSFSAAVTHLASATTHLFPLNARLVWSTLFRRDLVDATDSVAQGGPRGDRVVDSGHHRLSLVGKHSNPLVLHAKMLYM